MKTLKWFWTGPKLIKLWMLLNYLFTAKAKRCNKKYIALFSGRRGIRIGGELGAEFQECLLHSDRVIDVNNVRERMGQATNADYVTDAADLYFAKDNEFDFICSSHVLEHMANPIKAIYEWMRVIREGGIIYSAVPDKRFTFDHRRERTTLSHLMDDYGQDVKQTDTTHVRDLIDNWDERLDLCWDNRQQLLEHIRLNPLSGVHHHVWIKNDLIELFKYCRLEIMHVSLKGNTVHIMGKKTGKA